MANLKKMASGARQYTREDNGNTKSIGDMGTKINRLTVYRDSVDLSDAKFKKKYKGSKDKVLSMVQAAENDAGVEQVKKQYKKGVKRGFNEGGLCGASNPAARPMKKSK
jgi:heterodisulfide reductase subunit B